MASLIKVMIGESIIGLWGAGYFVLVLNPDLTLHHVTICNPRSDVVQLYMIACNLFKVLQCAIEQWNSPRLYLSGNFFDSIHFDIAWSRFYPKRLIWLLCLLSFRLPRSASLKLQGGREICGSHVQTMKATEAALIFHFKSSSRQK